MTLERVASIEDLRRLAHRRLPSFVTNYLEGGAGTGESVRRNIAAFRAYGLTARAFTPPLPIDTTTAALSWTYAQPFGISAVGSAGIYRRGADAILADVAQDADIPFILSGNANASIEAMTPGRSTHVWYQVYGAKAPDRTDDLIRRAHDAGAGALVYTIDYPIPPRSEASVRSGVSLSLGPTRGALPRIMLDALAHPGWTLEYLRHGGAPKLGGWAAYAPPGSSAADIARYFGANWLGTQTWHDLDRIRRVWPGPLVVKGILRGDDAVAAFAAGADAITISNHGGNRLDILPATLDALVEVREAVGPHAQVFFDGGIRRGSDILLALALGANFCFVGRATLYGVAAAGRAGATLAVELLETEIAHILAMSGCWNRADLEVIRLGTVKRLRG